MIRTGSSILLSVLLVSACVLDRGTGSTTHASCSLTSSGVSGGSLGVTGCGLIDSRFTAELAVRDSIAYTTTWGFRAAQGNMVAVWRVSGAQPVLIDSAIVSGASTLGDVAITDDGKWLVVATERTNGSI